MNSFSRNGGGLYITGMFRTKFKCYLQDNLFESNIGRGHGAIILPFYNQIVHMYLLYTIALL